MKFEGQFVLRFIYFSIGSIVSLLCALTIGTVHANLKFKMDVKMMMIDFLYDSSCLFLTLVVFMF